MLYSILIITTPLLIVIQLLWALVAARRVSKLPTRFGFSLSSRVTVAEVLQQYLNRYRRLDVKVDGLPQGVAQAHGVELWMHKGAAHRADIYSTVWCLYQILLTKDSYRPWQLAQPIQVTIFLLQLIALVLAALWRYEWLLPAATLAAMLIISSIILQLAQEALKSELLEVSQDVLDPDKVEQHRIKALVTELNGSLLTYPLIPFGWLLQLILPWRLYRRLFAG